MVSCLSEDKKGLCNHLGLLTYHYNNNSSFCTDKTYIWYTIEHPFDLALFIYPKACKLEIKANPIVSNTANKLLCPQTIK